MKERKQFKEVASWFAWVFFGVFILRMGFDTVVLAIKLIVGLFTGVSLWTLFKMFLTMNLMLLGTTVGGIILKTILDGKNFK